MIDPHITELLKYKTIIFYKEDCQFPKSFIQHIEPPYTIINLSVDKSVETLLTKTFLIQKLPCMFINGQIIYENNKNITLSLETLKDTYKEIECIVNSITTLDNIDTKQVSSRALNIINECLRHSNFIFIKGTPDRPECGFTRQVIEILRKLGLVSGRDYGYFNIFEDEDVRQTLKQVNRWPTFPQIYLGGEFVGGLDVLKEMVEDKSVYKILNKHAE